MDVIILIHARIKAHLHKTGPRGISHILFHTFFLISARYYFSQGEVEVEQDYSLTGQKLYQHPNTIVYMWVATNFMNAW